MSKKKQHFQTKLFKKLQKTQETVKSKIGRMILSSNCLVCGSKIRYLEQDGSWILSSLGINMQLKRYKYAIYE